MIDEGTRLYVVGNVRALDRPTGGATHGLAVVPGEEIRVALFSLEEQLEEVPESRQGGFLAIAAGVALMAYLAWHWLA